MQEKKVLVAMSGGIDSSAVCLMLLDQGYEVIGMTMRVWDLPRQFSSGNEQPDFIVKAQNLAHRLGIEHHVIDVRESFRNTVVDYFLNEYRSGRTPNPCVLCNKQFKFRLLAELADRLKCPHIATGHYVRTQHKDGFTYLMMGDDLRKDQSYFLWRVPQAILSRCLFPLGTTEKSEVRKYLRQKGFEWESQQSESMEICFVENDYRDFLREQMPHLAKEVEGGFFVDVTGRKLGSHKGVPFYTVGQRKGLGIALGHPAYVLRLNAEKNTVVLGEEKDLLTNAFFVENTEIIQEEEFFNATDLTVRIRYHSQPVHCSVEKLESNRMLVRTPQPVSAVTPGQSAVFYIGQRIVGGAIIASQKGIGAYNPINL